MPQPQFAKIVRFYNKPDNNDAKCDAYRADILQHVARIDLTRRHIWDPTVPDHIRRERGIPRRPAHIIAACDTLSLICANIRQVDAYLLHSPYKPLVDDGVRQLASKAMQVLAMTDWFGVPVEFVDLMKYSALKIMEAAGERREWYAIEAARLEAERKRHGGQYER